MAKELRLTHSKLASPRRMLAQEVDKTTNLAELQTLDALEETTIADGIEDEYGDEGRKGKRKGFLASPRHATPKKPKKKRGKSLNGKQRSKKQVEITECLVQKQAKALSHKVSTTSDLPLALATSKECDPFNSEIELPDTGLVVESKCSSGKFVSDGIEKSKNPKRHKNNVTGIVLGEHLRYILATEWNRITKRQHIYKLPAPVTVRTVAKRFLDATPEERYIHRQCTNYYTTYVGGSQIFVMDWLHSLSNRLASIYCIDLKGSSI